MAQEGVSELSAHGGVRVSQTKEGWTERTGAAESQGWETSGSRREWEHFDVAEAAGEESRSVVRTKV